MADGVLPPRDEELARTGQWLTSILATIEPAAGRRLVQAYATWHVMRRLRASAGKSARPRTYTANARNNIRAAADFITWLTQHNRSLQACHQADIDDWLVTGPGACQVRDFLTWAGARGHCAVLHVPGPARRGGTAASQDERWALAARLLHDDTLDLTGRAAGCLLLLHGQQLSRIAAMTTSQVTSSDHTVFVRSGRHDVPVPEPLGVIVTELIRTGRSHAGTGSPATTPWLFPGGLPGRPITASRLGQRLRILGIYAMRNLQLLPDQHRVPPRPGRPARPRRRPRPDRTPGTLHPAHQPHRRQPSIMIRLTAITRIMPMTGHPSSRFIADERPAG